MNDFYASHSARRDLFGDGPNARIPFHSRRPAVEFPFFAPAEFETPAEQAVSFLESLKVPEGKHSGQPVRLAPFQKQFVAGAMTDGIAAAVLSIGRGNAKTALSAGVALGGLLGVRDRQRRREVLIAARTRDQGRVAWDFVAGFCDSLPLEIKRRLIYRRAPGWKSNMRVTAAGTFCEFWRRMGNRPLVLLRPWF